eukprot:TRINITY_DN13211_c0_g1_i1.p1 TRINITY_DN13211_c0_g1~~TRINITY_DN13211_c0_g1_i1.p1  ORF type:complete len:407 (+),score=143.56 TRINITY_DN13211_c0_g1_i1:206-1426(+)
MKIKMKMTKNEKRQNPKKPSKKQIFMQTDYSLKLILLILKKDETRKQLLTHSEEVMTILRTLLQYFILIQHRMTTPPSENGIDSETLVNALNVYCRLFIHISGSFGEPEKDTEALIELVSWAKEVVLPSYLDSLSEEEEGRKRKRTEDETAIREFSSKITWDLCVIMSECIGFSLCSSPLIQDILLYIEALLLPQQGMPHLQKMFGVVSRTIYHLYNHNYDDYATALFQAAILRTTRKFLTSEDSKKFFRLNDLMVYHYQQHTLPTFVREMATLLMDSIQLPQVEISSCQNVAENLEDLEDKANFILSSLIRSKPGLEALYHHLSKNIADREIIWRILEISSVIAHTESVKKKKVDVSSVQNCLINILSKLPEIQEDDTVQRNRSLQSQHLRSLANSILKETMLEQ